MYAGNDRAYAGAKMFPLGLALASRTAEFLSWKADWLMKFRVLPNGLEIFDPVIFGRPREVDRINQTAPNFTANEKKGYILISNLALSNRVVNSGDIESFRSGYFLGKPLDLSASGLLAGPCG